MLQITLISGVAYPNPNITSSGDGELGEKTLVFVSDGHVVSVWRDNIVVIKLNATRNKSVTHERIVLTSGAVYQPANLIDQGEYGNRDIPDIFGEEQLAFSSLEGTFITRKNNVISLISQNRSRPAVTAQPIE